MIRKNLAFTLAEVLIVIGIIGVVAALTLPNLNNATGDKERVTKVKKIYSALTEAFDRAQAIYGDVDSWLQDLDCYGGGSAICSERLGQRITEFMKISKVCGLENEGCFTLGSSTYLNGWTAIDFNNAVTYKVITSDGMSVSIGNDYNPQFYVDIDGPQKGSFTFGKDLFVFYTTDTSNSRFIYPSKTGPGSDLTKAGNAAASWIIENDNADYLKADSSGRCNDSNIILNWTNNTSCH